MRTYEELLTWTYDLQKFGIKLGLSSTSLLLERLDDPHQNLPIVHIGGTNGKGSVAAMLSKALTDSGYKVGLYTSPHLRRFEERFRVNDRIIDKARARDLMERVQEAVNFTEPPTFFEFTTAMAFQLFAEEKTDIAIMEVGMGGRLDATNVAQPKVTVITNISMEHKEYLGDTLLKIASEKAGILKPKTPLVSAARQPEVVDYFGVRCNELACPFYLSERDFSVSRSQNGLRYSGLNGGLEDLSLGLIGEHQQANAGMALCVMELLKSEGFSWNETALRGALAAPHWPGRFQIVGERPTIVLDGAHNPAAAEVLAKAVRDRFPSQKVVTLVGIMADKDIEAALAHFLGVADEAVLSRPAYARAAEPEVLARAVTRPDLPVIAITPLQKAIETACAKAGDDGVVVITGSLFTVGEAMEILGVEP